MRYRPSIDYLLLIGVTALTRFLFRSRFLYDIDSVNFALALRRFDPSVHQPHPPGYLLYVLIGTLSNVFIPDANSALLAVSILASCGTVAMIYLLTHAWFESTQFGRAAARFGGVIFLVSPLAWFHGAVALTYIVEALFSACIGYFCWRIYRGGVRYVLPAATALGLAAGFRQSSLLILTPLFLFSIRRVPRRAALRGIAASGLVLAGWFLPMLYASGGIDIYMSSLWSLWTLVPARQTVFTSPVFTSLARVCVIVAICGLSFGPAVFLPLRASKPANPDIRTFTWIWLAPGLALFSLVYLKFVNSGYLLVLLPPACAWLGYWAADWYRNSKLPKYARTGLVLVAAAINVAVYLGAPFYFSYREVRRTGQELKQAVDDIRQLASPEQTILVGFDSHFLGYRHAGYYLAEYLTLQYPEVPLPSTRGVFAMLHQDTRVESRLRVGRFRNFLIFPLPSSDNEYLVYMQGIRARFSSDTLRAITLHGREYLTGPVSALPVLFPNSIAIEFDHSRVP